MWVERVDGRRGHVTNYAAHAALRISAYPLLSPENIELFLDAVWFVTFVAFLFVVLWLFDWLLDRKTERNQP
jgi:hypothetical protein